VTPTQKALVRRTWADLGGQAAATTGLFYERLFEINPNAQRLFRNKEMGLQGMAFSQMLGLFLRSLDDDDPGITEAIQACGLRHVGYGVMYSDYEGVGEALLWALERQLGPKFNPATREAWAEAYETLTATMRRASSSIL
jgi:hemoglobin-like flavoprotein